MGDMTRVMSRSQTGRSFAKIVDLETTSYKDGDTAWLSGRLHSIRVKGGSCFLVLRQNSFDTVQAVYFKDKDRPEESAKMLRYLKSLTVESVIQLEGKVIAGADVKSCSVQSIELSIQRIHAVSKADPILPFLVEDAARSEADVEASQNTDRPFPRLGQELRLDHRWMDLRAPANNAIMRLQSAVCQLFRESLYEQGFCEIHTPKLIAGESESGAGVFTTDYFGTTACLAQSPQLYKQMAVASDLDRVFEIGPVFRAENSNTRRHLCEFTGLDLEMTIHDHYDEALLVVHRMFRHIFEGLEHRFRTGQVHKRTVRFALAGGHVDPQGQGVRPRR
jgi:aspartyl-tRNA synthetase